MRQLMGDTALVRMVILELAHLRQLPLERAMETFYRSETCGLLSNPDTGLFTYTPYSLACMVANESSKTSEERAFISPTVKASIVAPSNKTSSSSPLPLSIQGHTEG
jgi:hypothetical protein